MKRINRLHKILSRSSACFTAILIRTELTEPSMRIRSFGFRLMTTGLSSNCFDVLQLKDDLKEMREFKFTSLRLQVYCDVRPLEIRNFQYTMQLEVSLE